MTMSEKTFIIPLRSEWLKAPKYKRAKRTVHAVKDFLAQHMKLENSDNVALGMELNHALWCHGIKNPPARIKVHCKMDGDRVFAELEGTPFPTKEEAPKAKGLAGKIADSLTGDKKDAKAPVKDAEKVASKPAASAKPAQAAPAKEAPHASHPASKPEAKK